MFVASAVEFVEATTIVLAIGVTRGWRAPLFGSLAATLTLAIVIAIFGVALVTVVPENLLKGVIGALVALAITCAMAYSGGDQGRDASGWVLLVIVLALVVANLYRAA